MIAVHGGPAHRRRPVVAAVGHDSAGHKRRSGPARSSVSGEHESTRDRPSVELLRRLARLRTMTLMKCSGRGTLMAVGVVLLLSGCTGASSTGRADARGSVSAQKIPSTSTAALMRGAPKSCPVPELFHLQQATRVRSAQASTVVAGHLPQRLPQGFGVQEVDRVEPGHLGYVAWTDTACRRVALIYSPGVTSVSGPAMHAFGPWMRLQGCGEPPPCVVYQGGVTGGLVTFSTWGLAPKVTADLLRTVKTGTD